MRLDYIEIGTSDFETLVETLDGYGGFHCPDYDTYRETIKHLLSLSYKQ